MRGRGLGAYVALLARRRAPARKCAARSSRDGPGLAGGGSRARRRPVIPYVDPGGAAPPDPFALVELSRDVRPPDYATAFVRQANELSGLERPLTVCAVERPEWLRAVLEEPGVDASSLAGALALYGAC